MLGQLRRFCAAKTPGREDSVHPQRFFAVDGGIDPFSKPLPGIVAF